MEIFSRMGERGQLCEGLECQAEGLKFYLFYSRDPFKVPEQGCHAMK